MSGFDPFNDIKEKTGGITSIFKRKPQYENFEIDQKEDCYGTFGGVSPESLPSPERPPLRHIDKYIKAEIPGLTKRYTIALLACFGFGITFGMRCNMSMAKLKMSGNESADIPFNWTVNVETAIDSSYFAGYFVTQLPGGFLASLYPANRIFGAAVVTSACLNIFIPLAMGMGLPAMVVMVKVTQGLVEGVTYPACHGIWKNWAPPLERSRLATMAFCGTYAGIVVGLPLSGLLTSTIGWQAPFYFYGCFGMTWYLIWLWLAFEKPCLHPTISAKELLYIEKSLVTQVIAAPPSFKTTPWKAFATSMPVYAIIVANFCRTWNFSLLVNFQSSYFNTMFGMSVEETGFVGAIPHLIMTAIVPFGGMLADHLRKNNIMSTTNVRKLFNCGGFGLEAFFFVLMAYAKDSFTATVELTLGVAFSGFAISGYNVNHLDIAPTYASILMGLSNGIGTIAGFLVPIIIHKITKDTGISPEITSQDWRIVYLMAAGVHFIGITFYAIFASGELQPWAEPPAEPDNFIRQKSIDSSYKETTFMSSPKAAGGPNIPLRQDTTSNIQYGATDTIQSSIVSQQHVKGNPFVTQTVPVQPQTRDYEEQNY